MTLIQAELYHNKMYTVLPKKKDFKLGVLPDDQGFSRKYVLLWDSYQDLIEFSQDNWSKLLVKIPEEIKSHGLTKIPDKAYGIVYLPSQWIIKDVTNDPPRYSG